MDSFRILKGFGGDLYQQVAGLASSLESVGRRIGIIDVGTLATSLQLTSNVYGAHIFVTPSSTNARLLFPTDTPPNGSFFVVRNQAASVAVRVGSGSLLVPASSSGTFVYYNGWQTL